MRSLRVLVAGVSVGLAFILFSPLAVKAQCSFVDFSSVSGLSLVGSAHQSGNVLRLTDGYGQGGAAWCTSKTFVGNGFSVNFQFRITGYMGGDGFTFAIQNSSPTALGFNGGDLGFSDIPNGIAVEFDTYFNGDQCDVSQDEVGFLKSGSGNGGTDHCTNGIGSPVDLSSLGTPITLYDGNLHTATVTYFPGSLTLVLDGQTVLSQAVTLDNYVALDHGRAWLGFTGATGAAWETADIVSWSVEANQPAYNLGFMDDYGRSALCLDTHYGNFQWTVYKGNGTGNSYQGPADLTTGSGYQRAVASPGSGMGMYLIYYTTAHRAAATFTFRPDAVSSALYDQDTTNDETSCGGQE